MVLCVDRCGPLVCSSLCSSQCASFSEADPQLLRTLLCDAVEILAFGAETERLGCLLNHIFHVATQAELTLEDLYDLKEPRRLPLSYLAFSNGSSDALAHHNASG